MSPPRKRARRARKARTWRAMLSWNGWDLTVNDAPRSLFRATLLAGSPVCIRVTEIVPARKKAGRK